MPTKKILGLTACLIIFLTAFAQETEEQDIRIAGEYRLRMSDTEEGWKAVDDDGNKEYEFNGQYYRFNGFEIVVMDSTRNIIASFDKLNEYGYVSGVMPTVAFFEPTAGNYPSFLIVSDAIEYEVYTIEQNNSVTLSGRLHIGNYQINGKEIYKDLEIQATDAGIQFSFNVPEVSYSFRYDKSYEQKTLRISSKDIHYIYTGDKLTEQGMVTIYPYSIINRLIADITDNFYKKLWDYTCADLNNDGNDDIVYTLCYDDHLYVSFCTDNFHVYKTISIPVGNKEHPVYIENADSSEIKIANYVNNSMRLKIETNENQELIMRVE